MDLERDALNALISYLRGCGYPPESFAVEFPVDEKGRHRADLAIVSPDTHEPVALFELKHQRTALTEAAGRRQLRSLLSALEVRTIPAYLVFLREGTPPFEIVPVSMPEDEIGQLREQTVIAGVPPYDVLTSSERNVSLRVKKNAQKKQVDRFLAVSMLLAAFVLGLLIASLRRQIFFSATELILLVIFVGLVLAPWASKIKFAGLEFERARRRDP